MIRKTIGLVAVAALACALPACGEPDEHKDDLLAAIARTERLSFKFSYLDERPPEVITTARAPATKFRVQGLVEDDFRFKARVDYDDAGAFDEVVIDDTLAMRFIEPRRLNPLINKEKVSPESTTTEIAGVSSLDVLQSRRWVLDESGAPSITGGTGSERVLGRDPVLDAISVLEYVARSVDSALTVDRFDPDTVSPAFSSSEDVFPEPESGSGVTRYDLRRPALPPPSQQAGGTGESGTPSTRHFRRMAVYVRDGRVIQVREVIDLRGKFLDTVIKYVRTYAKENGATEQELAPFEQLVEETPDEELSYLVLQALNIGLQASGDDPILVRTMTADLRDLGDPVDVALPATDVVKGSLGFLIVSDKGKATESTEGGSGAAPGGAGATTTVAPTSIP